MCSEAYSTTKSFNPPVVHLENLTANTTYTAIQSLTMEMIRLILLAVGHSLLLQKLQRSPSQLQVQVNYSGAKLLISVVLV